MLHGWISNWRLNANEREKRARNLKKKKTRGNKPHNANIYFPSNVHENMHDCHPHFCQDAGCVYAAMEWTPLLAVEPMIEDRQTD